MPLVSQLRSHAKGHCSPKKRELLGNKGRDRTADPNHMAAVAPQPRDGMHLLKQFLAMDLVAGLQQRQYPAVMG